jgi:hypothetical protein
MTSSPTRKLLPGGGLRGLGAGLRLLLACSSVALLGALRQNRLSQRREVLGGAEVAGVQNENLSTERLEQS